jgi:hypothetical protein
MQYPRLGVLLWVSVGCVVAGSGGPDGGAPSDSGIAAADAGLSPALPGGGRTRATAALSCRSAQAQDPEIASGVIWLNPLGGSLDNAFRAFCEFTADDGPWTLVAKVDGSKRTFKYGSTLWIDETVYQPDDVAPGVGETKNAGFWALPLSAIRIGMRVPDDAEEGDGETRYLRIEHSATSLRHMMVSGEIIATELGRAAWRSLIPVTSLQPNCDAEGVNILHRLRFGLLANEQDDCHTPDSWIGIGSDRDDVIAGNFAVGRWRSDNGDRRTKAFAEIWIRDPAE